MNSHSHENYRHEEDAVLPTTRSFGLVIAAALAVIAAINFIHGGALAVWFGGAAVLFVAAALVFPAVLQPLNIVWFKFGLLLHRIINPIIMAFLFFATILPISLIFRVLGKDLLQLKFDRARESYWIDREPPGPSPATMSDQF